MQTEEGERSASVERGRESWESGLQIRDVSMARSPRDESVVRDQAASLGADTYSLFLYPLVADCALYPCDACYVAFAGSRTERSPTSQEESPEQQQQVAQRSRWQAVLLEAGGIGAAVSEESMRRLKYCLQWLQVRISCSLSIL